MVAVIAMAARSALMLHLFSQVRLRSESFSGSEVDWPVFKRYLDLYDTDGSEEPPAAGKLSNDVVVYGKTVGLPVSIQFGPSSSRPTLSFAKGVDHSFAREAASGMSDSRYHEVLAERGHK